MPSAWVAHVKKFYQDRKKKDSSYKYSSAMKDARASYKKGGKAEEKSDEKAPKKRAKGRKAKAKGSKAPKRPPRDVAEPAAPAKKKKKPKRKRPGVPSDFTNLN